MHSNFVGRIEAARSSDLGFEIGGLVAQLQVEEGDRVAQGQRIAQLDTARLSARRREAVAQHAEAMARLEELRNGPRREVIEAAAGQVQRLDAQLELAKLARDRMATVYAKHAASDYEWDEARLEVNARAAGLQSAQARLNELRTGTRREQIDAQLAVVERCAAQIASIEVDIEKSHLAAPFSGTIVARLVDEGRVVERGRPVFRLIQNDRLEARIGVSAGAAKALSIGQALLINVGDSALEGRVRAIVPQRSSRTRTVTVIATLAATNNDVRDGDVARINVRRVVADRGTWLPTTALIENKRGLWACYVAVPDAGTGHRVEKHPLDVIHVDERRAFVRGTLQDSDLVIADGVNRLVPGQLVDVGTRHVDAINERDEGTEARRKEW